MRIEILMSTYNGEKYLEEQIDSLLNQDYSNYHITIRDDGSKDGTVDILKRYQVIAQEKLSVITGEKNLGYPDCFWSLLSNAPQADFYAFCDQDDVWEHNKLSCCAELCSGIDPSIPLLYTHDYWVCDASLKPYEEHHSGPGIPPREDIYRTIYYVSSPGFTMILNRALRDRILRDPLMGRNYPHDRWTLWCGLAAGRIVHDQRLLVKYRRHDASVTQTGKNNWIILKEWWREDVQGTRLSDWSRIARNFADCYQDELADIAPDCPETWRFIAGGYSGVLSYFKRLFLPRKLKTTLSGEIVLRICFALNKK